MVVQQNRKVWIGKCQQLTLGFGKFDRFEIVSFLYLTAAEQRHTKGQGKHQPKDSFHKKHLDSIKIRIITKIIISWKF